jgi:hypothetical protein
MTAIEEARAIVAGDRFDQETWDRLVELGKQDPKANQYKEAFFAAAPNLDFLNDSNQA